MAKAKTTEEWAISRDLFLDFLKEECESAIKEIVDRADKRTIQRARVKIENAKKKVDNAHLRVALGANAKAEDGIEFSDDVDRLVSDTYEKIDHYLSLDSYEMLHNDNYSFKSNMSDVSQNDSRQRDDDFQSVYSKSPRVNNPNSSPIKVERNSSESSQATSSQTNQISQLLENLLRQDKQSSLFNVTLNAQPDIKMFEGDPKEWPQFISCFIDLVHNAQSSDAQRFARLKQLLSPQVRAHISEYLVSSETYQQALDTLQKRYGLPMIIGKAHMSAIYNAKPIKDNDHAALDSFSALVSSAVSALRQNGYEDELKLSLGLEPVYNKLPPRLKEKYGMKIIKMSPRKPTLVDFADWLSEKVLCHRLTAELNSSGTPKETTQKTSNKGSERKAPHRVFATNESTSREVTCPHCKETHELVNCNKFKSANGHDKVKIIQELKLCFRCLKKGHRSSDCWARVKCNHENCGRRHLTLVHNLPKAPQNGPAETSETTRTQAQASPAQTTRSQPGNAQASSSNACLATQSKNTTTLLNVVPVILRAKNKEIRTHALLDSGSDSTLLKSEIASMLNLKGVVKQSRFKTFDGGEAVTNSFIVNVSISAIDESAVFMCNNVNAIDHLNLPKRKFDVASLKQKWLHLRDLNIPQVDYGEIGILIGADQQRAHSQLDCRHPPIGVVAPSGIRTPFGWCIVGPVQSGGESDPFVLSTFIERDDELSKQVEKFWLIETMPLFPGIKPPMTHEDKLALEIVNKSTVYNNEEYTVGLPWISPSVTLPNNSKMALRRLNAVTHRFRRDPLFYEQYESTIKEYIEKGYARKLPETEQTISINRTWYLPHHGVVHPRKPDKLRVVFDASARYNGVSLNSKLLKGPCLVSDIVCILLRYREKPIGVSGDIKQMFLQVKVKEEDRAALRFLWRTDKKQSTPDVYEMCVQIFGYRRHSYARKFYKPMQRSSLLIIQPLRQE